jgi:1-deoxy-D-xylulose-5-phosphate reductoisomerase
VAEDRALRGRFGELNVELLFGGAALEAVASHPDCDAVMAAIVGAAGLPSTLAAARPASACCSPTRKRSSWRAPS